MNITTWYKANLEDKILGRYINLSMLNSILLEYENTFNISTLGLSEEGRNIPFILLGNGEKRVLAWSQMHGNETTTTKALLDFLKFISNKKVFQNEIAKFLETYTLYIIPMLNPDGAEKYTRFNANEVDLNRDAQDLSQSESKALRKLFETVKPDLCLNLHDQRSIYGLEFGNPATISFLSPASDEDRTITSQRKIAMTLIEKMTGFLQQYIPNQVGRYDDSFNRKCVGDCFSELGVPTILFEAGHYSQDYQREKTRELIFYSFLSLFGIVESEKILSINYEDIPNNKSNFCDVIIENYNLDDAEEVSVAVQYLEVLKDSKIIFVPKILGLGVLNNMFAHKIHYSNQEKIITTSIERLHIGDEISHIINNDGKILPLFI